jgi:EAL and modified HD-GYP domain-containing signal transduction protein
MTPDLVAIAAAVDAAVPRGTRAAWDRAARRRPAPLLRGRVFTSCGRPFANVLGSAWNLPSQPARPGEPVMSRTDPAAVAADLRSTFRDLGCGTGPDVQPARLFVRVGRAFLAGDLPMPRRPDLLVVEVDGDDVCDAAVRDGLLRVKELGCAVALAGFTGRPDQRRLLPLADFVKVDARDLALEGQPLLDLASSRGAQLVAEFVDTDEALGDARAAGLPLLQGRVLERRAPLGRRHAVSSR